MESGRPKHHACPNDFPELTPNQRVVLSLDKQGLLGPAIQAFEGLGSSRLLPASRHLVSGRRHHRKSHASLEQRRSAAWRRKIVIVCQLNVVEADIIAKIEIARRFALCLFSEMIQFIIGIDLISIRAGF